MNRPIVNVFLATFIAASIISFTSCSNRNNDANIIKTLNEGLVNSSQVIDRETETILRYLHERENDPTSAYKAKIWLPKALLIQTISKAMLERIAEFRTRINLENSSDDIEKIPLLEELLHYRENLMEVDPAIYLDFRSKMLLVNNSLDIVNDRQIFLAKKPFQNLSKEAATSLLDKIQNNIKINANRLVNYCRNKVPEYDDGIDDQYSVLVMQNTNRLKPGDQLEITAGMGSFTIKGSPRIMIGGKKMELNAEGYVKSTFKVPVARGRYHVPVQITIIGENGKEEVLSKMVDYAVVSN